MSFFNIKELLTRKPEAGPTEFFLPYGLKPSEWSALRALRNEESFDLFLRTLDEVIKLNGEALIYNGSDVTRGIIQGIRKAATLIDEINAAQTLHEEQERKRKDAGNSRSSTRSLAFGTSSWNPRGP